MRFYIKLSGLQYTYTYNIYGTGSEKMYKFVLEMKV